MREGYVDSRSQLATEAGQPIGSLSALKSEINARINTLLPLENRAPVNLHRAMRYSFAGGGKRVRAMLCLGISEASQRQGRQLALDAGCAIEMVHTASLILDDLPSMDNASTRRGRPVNHATFGEATAILASFGLLNRAFGVISESSEETRITGQILQVLSTAIGSDGMIAGQQIDLHDRSAFEDVSSVEGLNWLKTGTLFVASAHIGALAAELPPADVNAVKSFASHVGLAFQTADDLIDETADALSAGKDVGQDVEKPTVVSIVGEAKARESCEYHLRSARAALAESGLQPELFEGLIDSVFGPRARP